MFGLTASPVALVSVTGRAGFDEHAGVIASTSAIQILRNVRTGVLPEAGSVSVVTRL